MTRTFRAAKRRSVAFDVGERQSEREGVGHVVGLGIFAQVELLDDHALHLLFARGTESHEGTLYHGVREVADADAVGRRRHADHAARVAHQHGRRRVAVRAPQLFDDHDLGLERGQHRANAVVQLVQPALECERRRRRDDACFDQSRAARIHVDGPVAGDAQPGIDAKDAHATASPAGSPPARESTPARRRRC